MRYQRATERHIHRVGSGSTSEINTKALAIPTRMDFHLKGWHFGLQNELDDRLGQCLSSPKFRLTEAAVLIIPLTGQDLGTRRPPFAPPETALQYLLGKPRC